MFRNKKRYSRSIVLREYRFFWGKINGSKMRSLKWL